MKTKTLETDRMTKCEKKRQEHFKRLIFILNGNWMVDFISLCKCTHTHTKLKWILMWNGCSHAWL